LEYENEFEKACAFIAGRDLQEIPKVEILDYARLPNGDVSNQAIIRLAIFYELDRCRRDYSYFRQVEPRSLRALWYAVVKPFLSRVEEPEAINQPKWSRYRTQTLSAIMSDMVLAGFVRYGDFKIEDRSRPHQRPGSWNKLQVGRFDEVVIFIEKDAAYAYIEKLADLLGFAVECGKGQQATAAIEGLIEYLESGKSYLVFCLTDWDYYGHLIMSSLDERAKALGIDAEFLRVGVEIAQVPEARRDVAKFRLPLESKQEVDWAIENAIEGMFGLEIEALTPQEIRGSIADAVYAHCDPEALYKFLKERALENVAGQAADTLASEDREVLDLMAKIEELEGQVSGLKRDLIEKLRPRAQDLLDELLDELDDRPDFPLEWLRQQIVEGRQYLDHSRFTDPSGIQEGLEERLRDEQSS